MGTLLVPHYDSNNELINLERIYFDKKEEKYKKRPLTGGQRIGVFYLIGEVLDPQGIILISEGYSSGATSYQATGYPTAISFTCGNIINVARILRHKYPKVQLLIIADNDQWHSNPKLRHAGLKAAKNTSAMVKGVRYLLPDFSILGLSEAELAKLHPQPPTDANDLFMHLMASGSERTAALDIVRKQLTYQPTPHAEILDQLLKKISRVNFTQLADIKDGDKLKNHHYLIITIEQILDLAKTNNWGICKNFDFIYVLMLSKLKLILDDF